MTLNVGTIIRLALGGIILTAVLGLQFGCSEQKTHPTLPGAHPVSWMNESSADFHGNVVTANGYESCVVCHGEDFAGGKVGVSCIDCHRESAMNCITCHGGSDNASGAPPVGLDGEESDTALAVGAHTSHLEGQLVTNGVSCDACHHYPAFVLDPQHLDSLGDEAYDGMAEIIWHGIADGGGAAWDRTSRTCSGTYCHGNFPGGYPQNAPVWTSGNQADCGSCHDIGSDPVSLLWKHEFHVAVAGLACADCHAGVVDSLFNIVGRDLHVNGQSDTLTLDTAICAPCHSPGSAQCTSCHGGVDNQTGAPPLGLRGESSTGELAVGAHTSHMETGLLADAFGCDVCHMVPTTFADPGHYDSDSIAEITWGNLSGNQASWNRAAAECDNVYCHGDFPGGYTSNTPTWTAAGQSACGSCHDAGSTPSDLSGEHDRHVRDKGIECYQCHAATVDSPLNIIGKSRHVDGKNDVVFSDQGSYSNGNCTGLGNGCHGSENWYDDKSGR